MKYNKILAYVLLLLVATTGCSKVENDDISFVNTATAPTDGEVGFLISNDNSGLVTITPGGAGTNVFSVFFGDATTTPATVQPGKSAMHNYAEGTYNVKVEARGATGNLTSTITKPLTVTYRAPEDVVANVTVNGRELTISATAKYAAAGFKVFFGDVAGEAGTAMAATGSLTHNYAATGNYTIKVTALSGGLATTSVTQSITIFDKLNLPLTFESATLDYSFSNFDGGNTTIVANPYSTGINTSGKVARMVKGGGQPWGGSIKTLTDPIDFSTKKTIKMKVYSPRVGAKVLFKVENKTNSATNFEKEMLTTKANQWEELSFNYTAINAANLYQNIVIIFDNGTMGDGSANFTFYFDDISVN